jgi:CheY-like chemotaxis protein
MRESSLQEIKAKPTAVCAKGHPLKPNNRNPILIVEDVYEIALQMRRALIQHGHEVITAASAEEAVQIAEEKLPAMILTDLELPTFDALTRLVTNIRTSRAAHRDPGYQRTQTRSTR